MPAIIHTLQQQLPPDAVLTNGAGNLATWLDDNAMPYTVIDVATGILPAPGRYHAIAVLAAASPQRAGQRPQRGERLILPQIVLLAVASGLRTRQAKRSTAPLVRLRTAPAALPAPMAKLLLENGITVSFASTGAKGFRSGDFWVFAARTADASVEALVNAPPRGVHHHHARLGVWTVGAGDPTDCRQPWPPRGGEGHDCACTAKDARSVSANAFMTPSRKAERSS